MKLGFFPYEPLHYKAAQAYLDKKAAQGLALKKVYLGCIAQFEAAEKPRHFVDLDIRQFLEDTDQDYLQLCADAGWEHVQTLRGMLLFRAVPGKAPIPIQTDDVVEFDRFWQKYRPRIWKILLPLAALWLMFLFFTIYSSTYYCTATLLTTNAGLLCLLYAAVTVLLVIASLLSSQNYLSKCRNASQIETPGKTAAALDALTLFQRLLACLTLLSTFLFLSPLSSYYDSLEERLSYHSGTDDPAILEEVSSYPVLTIHGLDIPSGSISSESISGRGSLLVRQLRQVEEFSVNGTCYTLATDYYQCATPAVARLLFALRLRDARNTGSITWSSDWTEISIPGFDQCYISYASDHSGDGYLLFRQGNVIAMAGCFQNLRPLDMTTPEALEFIRDRILNEQ